MEKKRMKRIPRKEALQRIGRFLGIVVLLFVVWYAVSLMPANRPAGTTFSASTSGGLFPFGQTVFLSETESYISQNYQGYISRVDFEASKEELDTLYKEVRGYKPDKILTYKVKVYDRGGSSVEIAWPNRRVIKENGGQSFLLPIQQDTYSKVYGAIRSFGVDKAAPHKKVLTLTIDDASLERHGVHMNHLVLDGFPLTVESGTHELLLGEHVFEYGYVQAGETEPTYGQHVFTAANDIQANIAFVGGVLTISVSNQ